MKTVFRIKNYDADCTPREESDGRFGAQVIVAKVGFHPEKSFRSLGAFGTAAEAVAYGKKFAEAWLERNG